MTKHIIEQRRQIASNIYGLLQEDESKDRTPLTDGVYSGVQKGEVVSFKKGEVEFQFKSPATEKFDGPVVILVQGKNINVQKEEVVKSNSPDFYGANCHVKQLTQNLHLQKSFGSDLTHQMFLHDLEKGGKRAVVGETRTYNGEKWVKHTDGWVHVSDRTGKTRLHQNDGKVVEGGVDHTSHYKTHIDRHERESGIDSKSAEREIKQKHSDKHLTTVDQPGGVVEYYHKQEKVATNDNGKVTYHDDETTTPEVEDTSTTSILSRKPYLQSTEFHAGDYKQHEDGSLEVFHEDGSRLNKLHPEDENISDIKQLIDNKKSTKQTPQNTREGGVSKKKTKYLINSRNPSEATLKKNFDPNTFSDIQKLKGTNSAKIFKDLNGAAYFISSSYKSPGEYKWGLIKMVDNGNGTFGMFSEL